MNSPKEVSQEEKEDEVKSLLKETIKMMFENQKLESVFDNLIWLKDFSLEFKDIVEEIEALSQRLIRNGKIMLFVHSLDIGLKYKIMGEEEKGKLPWKDFLNLVRETYRDYIGQPQAWRKIYKKVVEEPKVVETKEQIQKKQKEKAKKQLLTNKEKKQEEKTQTQKQEKCQKEDKGIEQILLKISELKATIQERKFESSKSLLVELDAMIDQYEGTKNTNKEEENDN